MKKYVDWILAHKVKAGLIILGLFLFPLLAIHFLYKWQTTHYLLQSSWSSGELITYIAGFEAFIGTVFLGIIASRQNEKANDLNKRMLENEEKRDVFNRQSSIVVINHEMYAGLLNSFASSKNGVFQCYGVPYSKIPDEECILSLTLLNTSKSFTIVKVLALESYKHDNIPSAFHCIANCVVYQKTSLISIAPSKECKIHFATTKEEYELFSSAILTLRLQLTNSVGETRVEKISFSLVKLHDDILSVNTFTYSFESVDGYTKPI